MRNANMEIKAVSREHGETLGTRALSAARPGGSKEEALWQEEVTRAWPGKLGKRKRLGVVAGDGSEGRREGGGPITGPAPPAQAWPHAEAKSRENRGDLETPLLLCEQDRGEGGPEGSERGEASAARSRKAPTQPADGVRV